MEWIVEDLRKQFGDVQAVAGLSFRLASGSTMALLGRNGAGKSTSIRLLASLIKPDSGRFVFDGVDLLQDTHRLRAEIGYVSQELALDKTLTGLEFMKFQAGIYHLRWSQVAERADELLRAVDLSTVQQRQILTYSGGMKRRLDLAAALLNRPRLLILDEPTTGLDVEGREQVWTLIREFTGAGGSIILASHDFREVAELADQVLIMERGSTACQGELAELKQGLGHLVAQVKLAEFMTDALHQRVKRVLEGWDRVGKILETDEATLFTLITTEPLQQAQDAVAQRFAGQDVALNSLLVQAPSLEDVYRFAVGGQL